MQVRRVSGGLSSAAGCALMSAQTRRANGSVPEGGSHESVWIWTWSFGTVSGATLYT